MTLKGACELLIQHCTPQWDMTGTIIVLFRDKRYDDLAALITYGNLEIRGSSILKKIFYRKD